MPIPSYQTIMLPFLQFVDDGKEHTIRELIPGMANKFNLTEEERKQLLDAGEPVFNNRVRWANFYLSKAKLVELPKRGVVKITKRGQEELGKNPQVINDKYLMKFPEYFEFRTPKKDPSAGEPLDQSEKTPEDLIKESYRIIRKKLEAELLENIKKESPEFFERLVVDLLLKMGYGGFNPEAGQVVGGVGDGGIDGVINEDKLGLDVVYIQAKKWKESSWVGRSDIQKFVGALSGKRAKKGIFLTTAYFSDDAKEYAESIETKVVLIDGTALAKYMVDYNLGVSTISSFEIKKIDGDYFSEE